MMEEKKMVWIIPGCGYEEKGLEDGVGIFYDATVGKGDHSSLCYDFLKDYKFEVGELYTHNEYAKFFVRRGMVVFFNCGLIDGKYGGAFYLPSQLTEKQIEFFASRKEIFNQNFHKSGLFGVEVWPDRELMYRTCDGFRDLKIESIIEGLHVDNEQELLYRELERQHENLKDAKVL